jgi:hypothetical protein
MSGPRGGSVSGAPTTFRRLAARHDAVVLSAGRAAGAGARCCCGRGSQLNKAHRTHALAQPAGSEYPCVDRPRVVIWPCYANGAVRARRPCHHRVLCRAPAAKRPLPRAVADFAARARALRPCPTARHVAARSTHGGLDRPAWAERLGINRIRRVSRSDHQPVRPRRRAVGAGVMEDDRRRMGRSTTDADCADRDRGGCRRAVRSIAHIDPCDDRDHFGGADACRS